MNLNISNKVYIVTGGSKGIGEGITRAIAEEGGIVVMATRSRGVTEALADELKEAGYTVDYILGDLQEEGQCQRIIEFTVNKYGRIDGIVNNAGVNDGASLEKGPEAFRASIKLNLYHYYDLVHYALPHLKETKGSIINIS